MDARTSTACTTSSRGTRWGTRAPRPGWRSRRSACARAQPRPPPVCDPGGRRADADERLDIAESPEWNLINEYNWLHDAAVFRSGKWGLRFDRNNKECFGTAELDTSATPDPGPLFAGGAAYVNVKDRKKTWGMHGVMHRNVAWRCSGMMVKGNNHSITRNTIFDTDPLNFENEGGEPMDSPCNWDNWHVQCTDIYCVEANTTCCVAGDSPRTRTPTRSSATGSRLPRRTGGSERTVDGRRRRVVRLRAHRLRQLGGCAVRAAPRPRQPRLPPAPAVSGDALNRRVRCGGRRRAYWIAGRKERPSPRCRPTARRA